MRIANVGGHPWRVLDFGLYRTRRMCTLLSLLLEEGGCVSKTTLRLHGGIFGPSGTGGRLFIRLFVRFSLVSVNERAVQYSYASRAPALF